jgi:hypothetical protein
MQIPYGMWDEIVVRMREGFPVLLEGDERYTYVIVWLV